jgi:hypothetical protein
VVSSRFPLAVTSSSPDRRNLAIHKGGTSLAVSACQTIRFALALGPAPPCGMLRLDNQGGVL